MQLQTWLDHSWRLGRFSAFLAWNEWFMALRRFFYLASSRLGRRAVALCRSINKHTKVFFFSSPLRSFKAPSIQNQCGTSDGLSDDWLNTISGLPAGPLDFFFLFTAKNNRISITLSQNSYKQRSRRAPSPAVRQRCDVARVEKCCLVWTRRAYSHWSMLPSAVLPSCKHRSHTQVVITGSEEWDNTKTQELTRPHSFF